MTEMGQGNGRKIRNKNAAISRLETGTTSPQGTASTQPYGLVAKASRFQPSGGTPKNVKNLTNFVPLGVPSLSSLLYIYSSQLIHIEINSRAI